MRRRNRSRTLLVLPFFLAVLAACTDPVRPELDETHAKLDALKELVSSVNRDLSSLQAIVSELDDSHTVTGISPVEASGYDLSFKDGKLVRIHFGKDGVDGRVLPLGVRQDENGVYCWTVDGEWLLDAEGNPVPAGASDGKDGFAPQMKVEDGFWWISLDGGDTFDVLASCEEMDGFTVFKAVDPVSDPEKVLLTLHDGTVLELPRYIDIHLTFGESVLERQIAPGERLAILYSVSGSSAASAFVTTGTDGTYFSEIERLDCSHGQVWVTAPTEYVDGYILLNAFADGYSAVQMVTFSQRKIDLPEGSDFDFPVEGGALTVAVVANFGYQVVVDEACSGWLQAVKGDDGRSIFLVVAVNDGIGPREGTVLLQPLDNPGFTCTVITVRQAAFIEA